MKKVLFLILKLILSTKSKILLKKKKPKLEIQTEIKGEEKISINSFDQLLKVCNDKKEIKLKYELEKNVNLVHFEKNRIEISFNENLDKLFVKDLSLKLFEWTKERWIITLSKTKGDISIRQKEDKKKIDLINSAKNLDIYKNILKKFPDAKLTKVDKLNDKEEI